MAIGAVAARLVHMFIALRDLRFARGRFALLGAVIALMTLMVVLLSGLTAGLGEASISAVRALPVDSISFQTPATGQSPAFSTSTLPAGTTTTVSGVAGVTSAHPLGVSTTRMQVGDRSAAVALIGTHPMLFPERQQGGEPAAGQTALTADLADELSLGLGDQVEIAGQRVVVASIVDDTSFNHLPVAYTPIGTWQALSRSEGITAVVATGDADFAGLDRTAGTTTVGRDDAFNAVGAYSSEQRSLQLMRALLLGVSVLIVGAFFTVWTMQRSGELAVVRAIGGSQAYLLRDALGQAAVILAAGTALGGGLATGLGVLAARAVPFVVDTATVAIPIATMIAIGVLGAAVSVRRVVKVDPVTALGAAR